MDRRLWQLQSVILTGSLRPRLEEFSLEISAGVTAIIGFSGAGKTSLLNLLVGFERPDRGEISNCLPVTEGRLPLFWVPADDGLWPHLTAREQIALVMPPGPERARRVSELLEEFDLAERAEALPDHLSQGERSRLAVARGLAAQAAVLVMDEPLVHVDPARLGAYWQAIRRRCREEGTSLVLATHSPEVVLCEADTAICLKAGRVLYAGDVAELYHSPPTAELASFLGAANWLSPGEAADWLAVEQAGDQCYRPEQLAVARVPQSPLIVRESRFAGSIAEVDLLDERTHQTRTFFHRPPGGALQAGDRVLLKISLLLLSCLLLAGCGGNAAEPRLAVRNVKSWSLPPEGTKLPAPRAVHAGPNRELYVLDNAGRVLVYDDAGQLQRQWKMPEYSVGKPEKICVFKDGRIAVADTHYHRVVFFDRAGRVTEMLGSHGKGPSQFIYPVAIVQDADENFYVCEYGNNDRVQKFSKAGKLLLQFGSFGTGPGQFQRPSGIVWHAGRVYVVDAFNNRIQVFSDSGKFLEILGADKPSVGLDYPYDIAKSDTGDLFIVEYGAGRVTRLDMHGNLLGRFGTTGTAAGEMATPWGLTVDSQLRVWVADTGNRRIVELQL